MKLGLVSITFRQLSIEQIVELVREAGLDGIEWGGDIHVPHGDLDIARRVARLTGDMGLETAAYGSYYRAGEPEDQNGNPNFQAVVDTARTLGTSTIRVWAGNRGSADADETYRAKVVADLERIDRMAMIANIAIALEFHGGTLTDTTESTRALMNDLEQTRIQFYWQPQTGIARKDALSQIRMLAPRLSNLHVFAWNPVENGFDRRPLQEHENDWTEYLATAREVAGDDRWALLEFVRDDDPERFKADAKRLVALTS
jgi:3-dehydroshikimate dehydratase